VLGSKRQTPLAFEIGVAAHSVLEGIHDASPVFGGDGIGSDGFFG